MVLLFIFSLHLIIYILHKYLYKLVEYSARCCGILRQKCEVECAENIE